MKLPVVSAREVIKALSKIGYYIERQKGSHISLAHPLLKTVTIPNHKEIKKGMLKRILNDAELTIQEFRKLLKR